MTDLAEGDRTLPGPVRPERLVMMGLELGQGSDGFWEAHRELAQTSFGALLEILHTAPSSSELVGEAWRRTLASPEAQALLEDEEPDFEALDLLLERIGSDGAGPILDLLSESDSLSTRNQLYTRLAGLGPAIAPEVIRRTRDDRWFARRNMLALMGEFDEWPKKWNPAELSNDEHPAVRREALKLMLRVPDCRDRALCGLLSDGEPRALALGLAAAVKSSPPEAVPLLGDIARDESLSEELRVMSVRALGLSGDEDAVAPLLELIREGMPKGPRFLRSRRGQQSPVMLAALQALSTFPDCPAEAERILAKAAGSKDPDVRAAALGSQER
jgi:HEAT repeat protein